MLSEQGYVYEHKCNTILDKIGILPGVVSSYGKNNDADGAFVYNGKIYNIEYKKDYTADFGQATLAFDTKKNRWFVTGEQTAQGIVIQQMIKAAGAEQVINSSRGWGKGIPNKYTKDQLTLKEAKEDYRNFPDRYINISSDTVNSYYAMKNKFYIQIGDCGFYYMQSNPAGLNVPQFSPTLRVRFRVKPNTGGLISKDYSNYRFVVALQVAARPVSSPYDIVKDPSFLLSKKDEQQTEAE